MREARPHLARRPRLPGLIPSPFPVSPRRHWWRAFWVQGFPFFSTAIRHGLRRSGGNDNNQHPQHMEQNTITVRTSFATYTPESIENGDAEERGWENEQGETFTQEDPEEDPADAAADHIIRAGAVYASQSPVDPFSGSLWWSTDLYTTDYSTGEQREEAFHLSGDPDTIRRTNLALCKHLNIRHA